MGIVGPTYYDRPQKPADDTGIAEAMFTICDEFEFYGYLSPQQLEDQHIRQSRKTAACSASTLRGALQYKVLIPRKITDGLVTEDLSLAQPDK